MALNDFHTTYKCLLCGSDVEEIPGIDAWGEHVYSYYECTNCGQKCESSDMDYYVKTIFHDHREKTVIDLPKIANEFDNTYNSDMLSQPLGEKVRLLINKIPTAYPIKDEVILSYKNMSLDARDKLIYAIDCIIDNCKRHILQWEKIKEIIETDKNIKRLK